MSYVYLITQDIENIYKNIIIQRSHNIPKFRVGKFFFFIIINVLERKFMLIKAAFIC